ncbi:MAG TPA: GGDEF domain-containing protein [Polyangia bacterium]|nr:GGDEF domain-containing protein [Polyangia bacterium]
MPSPARRPRRLVYPTIGVLLSVGLVLGLLALQMWVDGVGHRAAIPGRPWRVTDELRRQPLVYGYLLAATVALTTVLGWLVGRKEDLLEALSVTDPLTGLANRRRLLAAFADELNRSARYGTPLALLLIDLDRLKEINDRRGHAQGDRALQLVAESLRRSCRATDLAARIGGDEFLVLAVNTSAGEALALAHRICATVRRLGAAAANEKEKTMPAPAVTVSIGVADLDDITLPTFLSLHAAADAALYAAKAAGRDRVHAAPPRADPGTRPSPVDRRSATFRQSPP